jgi:hypothetical protein
MFHVRIPLVRLSDATWRKAIAAMAAMAAEVQFAAELLAER